MECSGWGLYPKIDASMLMPRSSMDCIDVLTKNEPFITQGMGRSYGDSSLAPLIISTRYLNHFIDFNEKTGLLTCESGILLKEILAFTVPRGWFLPVTPGTQMISLGGAIASDVHGKNHHIAGTFSEYVTKLELLIGNGERINTSMTENTDLFHATCGGMGLTGIILSASIQLQPISSSNIIETIIKCSSLDVVLNKFETYNNCTYSVAWIDCLATGKNFGRSILRIGEHATDNTLELSFKNSYSLPIQMFSNCLKDSTMKTFNTLYYLATRNTRKFPKQVFFESFFYPLDKLKSWNLLYGRQGFVQYQFVLPKESSEDGLKVILKEIAQTRKGSFLAVLKMLGKENNHYLSFPKAGYTLALDFKMEPLLLNLLNRWDKLVLHYGGRLYLTKDARMSEETFKKCYPNWIEFEQVRAKYYAHGKFSSQQSQRLGLQ